MNDAKKEKQKQNLVEAGLMEQDDTLVDYLQASYVQKVGKLGQWKQGWAYFTETRLICITGPLDDNIVIPYRSIRKIGKRSQGLFPMGIEIAYETPEGNLTADKLSMTKRDKWIKFLEEKSGVACA